MAIHAPITPHAADEDLYSPSTLTSSPISLLFAAMLLRLEVFIETEHEIDGVARVFDPACAAWLHDAENALDRLTDTVAALQLLPKFCEGDGVLLHFTGILSGLISAQTANEAAIARVKAVCLPDLLQFTAKTFEGHRAFRLVQQGTCLVEALQTLELFREAHDAGNEPSLNREPTFYG